MEFTVAQAKRRARLRRQLLLTQAYILWHRSPDTERAALVRAFRVANWGLD